MASSITLTMDPVKLLFIGSETMRKDMGWEVGTFFGSLSSLIRYVEENISRSNNFILIIPNDILGMLVAEPIYAFNQVRRIYVYYDNNIDLKRDKAHYGNASGKLQFYDKRRLGPLIEKLKNDAAINSPGLYTTITLDIASAVEQRILEKRENRTSYDSSKPKRFTSKTRRGYNVKNIEQIHPRYICSNCKFLFREPHQLECGCRICKCCINHENE